MKQHLLSGKDVMITDVNCSQKPAFTEFENCCSINQEKDLIPIEH
jgi:hypothetical protein